MSSKARTHRSRKPRHSRWVGTALDPPYKFQMPDVRTRSRVGCVKQSADAPVAQAETLMH